MAETISNIICNKISL